MSVGSNEIVEFGFRLARKTRCEDECGSQRAGLMAHCCAGAIIVAPDLRGGERDEQAENYTERGQHARRNGLERFGASAPRQRRNTGMDR
jgi:hypothetical protein